MFSRSSFPTWCFRVSYFPLISFNYFLWPCLVMQPLSLRRLCSTKPVFSTLTNEQPNILSMLFVWVKKHALMTLLASTVYLGSSSHLVAAGGRIDSVSFLFWHFVKLCQTRKLVFPWGVSLDRGVWCKVLRHKLLPMDLWTNFFEPFVCGLVFHKGFTIMVLFMGWFFHGPFAQETKICEPISQIVWTCLTNGLSLACRGKFLQNSVPAVFSNFSWCKNTLKEGKLDAKTVCCSKIVFVEHFVIETLNMKPSLLHFLCWTFWSKRTGLTKCVHPSNWTLLSQRSVVRTNNRCLPSQFQDAVLDSCASVCWKQKARTPKQNFKATHIVNTSWIKCRELLSQSSTARASSKTQGCVFERTDGALSHSVCEQQTHERVAMLTEVKEHSSNFCNTHCWRSMIGMTEALLKSKSRTEIPWTTIQHPQKVDQHPHNFQLEEFHTTETCLLHHQQLVNKGAIVSNYCSFELKFPTCEM